MNRSAGNRCSDIRSFIVCFYCNETFRSLSSLLKHRCSAEEKISLNWEPHETVPDTNEVDFTQENWESLETFSDTNDVDLTQEDWEPYETTSDSNDWDRHQENFVCAESISEKLSDVIHQVITETELNKNICKNSLPGTEMECEQISNTARQVITDLASDTPEENLEANVNVVTEVTKLVSNASEKQSLEANSNVIKEVSDLASDVSKKLLVESLDTEQNISKVDSNADDEYNRASPDLVSKVLQYYEKQTKQNTTDGCCKTPSTEIKFQSSQSQLPTKESNFPRHDNTQMNCNTTDICSKISPLDTKPLDGKEILDKESGALKKDAKCFESRDSDTCSRSSSPEVDSSGRLSSSSSIGCDHQAEPSNSDVCCTLSLSEKKSNELKLHASHISDKLLPEQNLNITKYGSVILKSCYVKIQDIFKSLSNPKLNSKKIFSWKKKYHVCDVCYKFFRLRSDLNIHYLIHTSVKPYVCNICEKSFMKQCNLFAHHLAHTIKRHHVCSVCKKTFLKRSLLLRHKLTHTKEKRFACDKCNKSYSVKSSLNEHYLSHSDERPFICEICSASFHNKRYLRKHYYKHQRKENVCEFCFRIFQRKHHLDEHYNIHVNDRPHECKICGKSFHLLLTLNKHYSVAHRKEKDHEFQKKFKSLVDGKSGKKPVIQKIKKSAIVKKGGETLVQKIEKPIVIVKSEEIPDIKVENFSVDIKNEESAPYSTRRKSFMPRKYLQPDTFILY